MGEEQQPPPWAKDLLKGQADQSRSIEKVSDEQERLGTQIGDVNGTVNDMAIDMTKLQANVDHIKERAKEDREAAEKRASARDQRLDAKEAEVEGKIGVAHNRVDEVKTKTDTLTGEVDNHMKDEHATVALQTKAKLDEHMIDDNRHSGESPGGGTHLRTAGLAAGGGGLIWGAIELVKALTTGSGNG